MKRVLYPIRLNGVGLEALDERIVVTNIEEEAPKLKLTTAARARYDGQVVTRRERVSRSIEVQFVIWERDKQERMRLFSRVMAWADGGGELSYGAREGQKLGVVCERLPDMSGREWTEELSIRLTSYDPYWRGVDPMVASLPTVPGEEASITLRPDGTARETFLMFDIKNTGAAPMTSATIGVICGDDDYLFAFDGLSVPPGEALQAHYDDSGFLSLTVGGVSVMGKRSGASTDDLVLVQRGDNHVNVVTDVAALVTLRAFEQWL